MREIPRLPVALPVIVLLGCPVPGEGVRAQSLLMDAIRPQPSLPQATVRTFKDWQIVCHPRGAETDAGAAPTCFLRPDPRPFARTGDIISLDGRKVVLPGRDRPSVVFVLETRQGLLLPDGVGLQVDGRAMQPLAFHTCERRTCTVPFAMTESLTGAFRKGGEVGFTVTTLQKTKRSVTVSLLGFTAAMNAFEKTGPMRD